jgi:hypothetical protein
VIQVCLKQYYNTTEFINNKTLKNKIKMEKLSIENDVHLMAIEKDTLELFVISNRSWDEDNQEMIYSLMNVWTAETKRVNTDTFHKRFERRIVVKKILELYAI